MSNAQAPADLSRAVRLQDIRAGREALLPSAGALEWHFRRYKARYAREGAVAVVRGAIYVLPERFDEVFAKIAHEEAVAKLAGAEPAAA